MKHTKGEWKPVLVKVTNEAPACGFCIKVEGKLAALCGQNAYEHNNNYVGEGIHESIAKDFYSSEEIEANAKLIAAAPDLLEALIEIKGLYGDRDGYIGEYKSAWDNVTNAIQKATE